MRKDLNKLLCEHERVGSGNSFKGVRHNKKFTTEGSEGESLAGRESMTKRYKVLGEWKEFGENLNPLYGFIRKSVGKPWNNSYSELCSVFNMSSVINQHIVQHLFQIVKRDMFIVDGKVCYRAYRGQIELAQSEDGPEFYIHPGTGILMENKRRHSWKRSQRDRQAAAAVERLKTVRVLSKTLQLRKRGDVWFVCKIEEVPRYEIYYMIDADCNRVEQKRDAYRYCMWEKANVSQYGPVYKSGIGRRLARGTTYVTSVRTASHKELKQYGVL